MNPEFFLSLFGGPAGAAFPWGALASLGLPLLAHLFPHDNQEELRRYIQSVLSPKAIGGMANAFQDQWYQSPAYAEAQRQSLAAGRAAATEVGRAGVGVTSGLDVLKSGAAAGVGPATLSRLNASAYMSNLERAIQASQSYANALTGLGPRIDYGRELFGAGLNFLGPILSKYYTRNWGK